jgi:hypothetical protein
MSELRLAVVRSFQVSAPPTQHPFFDITLMAAASVGAVVSTPEKKRKVFTVAGATSFATC